MSEEDKSQKTEEATPRKLEEARKKGDVVKSMEIAGFVVLFAGTAAFATMGQGGATFLAERLSGFFAHGHALGMEPADMSGLMRMTMITAGLVLAGPVALLFVAALAGHLAQAGFILSAEKIKPKLDKLNPIAGVGRMFGPAGMANFGKGVAKMAMVGAAAGIAIWPRRGELTGLASAPLQAVLPMVFEAVLALLIASLVVYAVIAVLDYIGQRHSFMQKQRMSRQDIKDETKQSEGDPQVKARLRQIRADRSRRRMMAAVPEATVVITNPTHFAVALRYEEGETPAPICVAKGVDAVALRIRALAKEHDVPVVEDPPLARALFASVELNDVIAPQHFAAVAKIIGAVLSMAGRRRAR